MPMSEQLISNEDLAVITAAVHLYLNNGQAKAAGHKVSANSYQSIRSARPKQNKWRWSFSPYINKQGLKDFRWSN
jgi:hypothetical protein